MVHETGWTDRRIATLRREWGGGMSARDIGEAIGMSKSAVIGKARRLGLPSERAPIKSAALPKRSPTRLSAMSSDDGVPLSRAADSPIRGKSAANRNRRPATQSAAPASKQIVLADLTQQQCRYPYGDRPVDIRFCGHPVMARGDWRAPYCEFHQGRCYVAPEKRKRAQQSTSQKRGRLSLAIPT